jgi:riboflavin transporter FmnP
MKASTGREGASALRFWVRIGVLSAVGFMLMLLEFNFPFFPPYLQYDPSEVPALIGGFAMGPAAGFAVVAGKCILFLISGKDEAGVIGTAANFVAGFPLVLVAAWVYRRVHTLKGAVAGMVLGILAAVAATSIGNYLVFLPAWGITTGRWPLILGTLIPFNAIKGVVTSGVTLVLYKRLRALLQ